MIKGFITAIILSISVVYVVSAYVGWQLTHPQRRALHTTPATAGLSYEDIEFPSRHDGIRLKGWLIKGNGNKQTIIFAHGYGRNRLQDDVPLLPLVQALVARDINVVMFDFRNSGESEGHITSVGFYEVDDLLGAVDFVESRSDVNHRITVYGFSMGASTAILAATKEPRIAAVIGDAPFADLHTYLCDNLSVWSNLPKVPFNYTILSVIPMLTGLKTEEVSPLQEMNKLGGRPLLLIHGEADVDIPASHSLVLQQRYANTQLVLVPKAGHVASFRTDRVEYFKAVAGFLQLIQLSHSSTH